MEAAIHSGKEMDEEIIDEPKFDASSYSFHSADSELVKYFYSLKFPDTYSLPSKTILELVKNKEVEASLQKSVTSFIDHLNNSNSTGSNIQSLACNFPARENSTHPIFNANWVSMQLHASKMNDISNHMAHPSTSTATSDFAIYDSVHSIKMPLHTLRKSPKYHPYFKSLKSTAKTAVSVPEVTTQMSGLAFNKEPLKPSSVQPKCLRETQFPRSAKGLTSSPFFRKQNVSNVKKSSMKSVLN